METGLRISTRIRTSPYFESTIRAGATHFSVYNHMYMPVSYGDAEGEYWRLVNDVSVWDVAAQRQVAFEGPDADRLADYLAPREVLGHAPGRGLYVPLCDHDGRIINDPILLQVAPDRYWMSIADSDVLLWVKAVAAERGFDARVYEPDVSPLAIQGPKAVDLCADLLGPWVKEMRHFEFRDVSVGNIPVLLCRSGWSRRGGFELFLKDGSRGDELWELVMNTGRPYRVGPGTPSYIERLESGLLSYGADTDAETDPLELGLERFMDIDKPSEYIGKAALQAIRAHGPKRRLLGVHVEGPALGVNPRKLRVLKDGTQVGFVGAAGWSPRLNDNVGLALLNRDVEIGAFDLAVVTDDGERRCRTRALPFP